MTAPTFHQYLQAGYPCLWVTTHEEPRAIKSLSELAEGYKVFSWDIMAGLRNHETGIAQPMPDPVKALEAMNGMPEGAILFYKDGHKFLQNINVIRTVKNMIPVLKSSDKHLVFISPITQIPIELEKDITTFPFNLPTVGELMAAAQKIVEDNGLSNVVEEATIGAAQGMTLDESENAMSLSLITEKTFSRKILESEKLQAVKKSGLMELYPAVEETEHGGLENLKKYLHKRKQGFTDPALAKGKPKGILLLGMPGTGKSLSAKVVASILELPLVRLDFSSLKSSLVGDSEKRLRQALQVIDALHGSVVWLEEVEKAVSGVQSSGKTDGGTTSAMFGALLTWMEESKSPHYLVGTVNDVEELLSASQGALLRRFDNLFYVDAPDEDERKSIIAIMNRRYGTDISEALAIKMAGWTGAEIEKFTRASLYDGIEEAFSDIKPISEQNKAVIDKAREWASVNCKWANAKAPKKETAGRRIKT